MALDFEKIDLGGFGVDSQIQDETATVVKSNMGEAFKENPDAFAKNLQLSKESGVPEFAVKSDPVEVETKLKLDKIDFSTMSQRNPNTAKYLVDFNNAVIAQDDLDSLMGIENVLTPVSDVARSLPAGFVQAFGSAFEGAGRALDVGSRTLARGLDVILPEAADPYLWSIEDTPEALKALKILEPQTFLKWEGSGLKQAALDMGAPVDRQNVATDISGAVGSMGGQLMAYLMNPTASLGMLFSQGVDIQGEKQEQTGTEGQSLQSDAAQLMGGVITGASEKMGLDAIVNRIPPNIKNAALRQIADVSLAGGIEAVQEVTESIAQNVLELYTTNPDAEIFEGMGREAIAAGGAGAIVRAIVNSMVPGKARALSESEVFAEQLGTIEQEKLDLLNLNSENSKLRQRDRESFRQFVQQSDGDQNTNVFMDSAQVALYLQTKRPDEIANDPALQMLAKGAREASALGTDVVVPVADFAADVAGTPHYEQLRDHMTMSQETVTPFRQEQARVETTNYIQRMVAEAETNISEYVEAQEIYNTVRDQLIDSGMVSGANASIMAQIVPAWATSFAKREGITVAEAYARSGLTIQGPQTGEAARLSAEALAQSPITRDDLVTSIKAANPELKIDLTGDGGTVNLNKIIVPEGDRSAGVGSSVMTQITDWADANGKKIALTPSTDFGGNKTRLVKFYKRFGFVENKGRNKDFTISESMVREPKAQEQFNQSPAKQTDTEAFKKWFGDSKVVNESGEPLVVYHGTGADISEFSGDGRLTWVSEQSDLAGKYAERGESPNILPTFITVKNPLKIPPVGNKITADALSKIVGFKLPKSLGTEERSVYRIVNSPEFIKAASKAGYDGLFGYEAGRKTWAAFEPTQIKSAIGNTGAFDPNDPSILKQESRGYYDPANAIIRLNESADLSTFLHEFAHFMYEMEMKAGSKTIESVNNWFKRNAESVAAEANSYIGAEGDLAQSPLENENFKKWFGESKVVDADGKPLVIYHGTSSDFDAFDENSIGKVFGADKKGFFFTSEHSPKYGMGGASKWAEYAATKGGSANVMPVYLNIRKPFTNADAKKFGIKIPSNGSPLFAFEKNRNLILEKISEGGYDGLIFKNQFGTDYIAFEPTQIKSAIGNTGAFNPNDPSILKQDTIPTGEEGSITPDDVINFLDTGTSGDAAKDSAIRRATHEQFARGFETYLMEGKAPSIELRNAFRTFARWLVQIYQSIKGDLRVRLDDEVRQVFDRLLATEEQIIAAESRLRYEPMFTDAAMAGMSEQEFIDYKKRQEKVKDKQSETLRDKIIKQLTRQTEQWWRDEKQDLIREEVAKLNEQPVYAARTRLTSGDLKLDHATVKQMVGETFTNARGTEVTRIPPTLVGMTAKGQAGIHPDEAAAFLGYSSGSELIHDLMTAPKVMDAAAMNAEQRMLDTHGDILNDGSIEQQADEAVMNEERGKLFLDELKALSKGTNAPSFDHATVKAIAQERIARLSFRENHPAKYRNAEIRAAQESAAMLAKGNREGAAAAKARQVLNYYLAMASTEARNETDKIVTRMARYNKKSVREEIQKADGGYWDQIVKILQRFEFRKSATLSQVAQQNQDINTWAKERIESDGDGLVLSPIVMNESYVTHWKNVPFGDLQGVADSVKNIEHVARYANKITRMGEEVDFNQLVARWTASMNEKATDRFTPKRTDVIEGRNWGRWAMAQMTKIPFMASWMDGGERTGISHQILVQPFTDAYSAEMALWRQAGKPVMDAIEGRSKADIKRQNQKIFIPEINDNLFGHQIIAVALNTGNAGNLRKMLLGEGWANPDNDAEINFNNPKLQAVLRHMTKSDWELVQLIWDQMEVLYPQLAEVHKRTTGLIPPKVDAVPVVTPYGEFRGGYYPVKYDPGRSHQAEQNEEKRNAQIESMFSNTASIQASVNAGSTNARTGYYAPIRLSLDVVPAHFQESIHYITHHDPVREVNRLIRNKSVADTIKAKLGPEEYAQLKPWLNDIAKDGQEAPTKMFWDSMLQKLRFGVTLGTMGFKASTGIIQISGLSNTIGEVGLAPTMQAVRSILSSKTNMVSAWEFAKANSKVLENRAVTMDREIKNAMKQLESKRGVLAATQEVSMKHIALIQTYMVDLPSWHAAYIKGMSEWGDEARAFQYADWVIEQVQGSGATKDLARIMRGQSETGRMLTMFMTFFSSLWNLERDLVKGAKSGRYSTTTLAAKAMFLFTIPVLFDMLMKGELGGDDEDDEESTLQKMLTKVALYPMASVPFMRDIANGLLGEYGYNISPLASIMEQGVSTIPKVVVNGLTDEEITGSQAKGATKFIGAALGVPGTSQAWATGEHIYQVVEEGEEFSLHSLLFGPEKK